MDQSLLSIFNKYYSPHRLPEMLLWPWELKEMARRRLFRTVLNFQPKR